VRRSRGCLREEIPSGELQTILDNIGLPNSGINQSYSTPEPSAPAMPKF
jgi:hypothetical protein